MKRILIFMVVMGSVFAQEPVMTVPPLAAGKVRVYFYLSPTTYGYTFKIYADQTAIAKLRYRKDKKHYWIADLDPGRHMFYVNSDVKHGIIANLSTDREYFVSCSDDSIAHASIWIGRSTMPCILVDPQQGKSDIEKLTLKESK